MTRTPTPEPGIYPGTPKRDYLAWDALNQSVLTKMARSESHARQEYLVSTPAKPAQVLGDALHAAALEPGIFERNYVEMPTFPGHPNSNKHRGAKAEWLAEHEQQVTLTSKEYAQCLGMITALRETADEAVIELLHGERGANEVAVVWQDEITGLLCKCRLDRMTYYQSWATIVELKTTENASKSAWDYDFGKWRYHFQAAVQLIALENEPTTRNSRVGPRARRHIHVVVEKHPPHGIACYETEPESIEQGKAEWREYLDRWAKCIEQDRWPSYEHGVVPVQLPPYKLTKVLS